jgi:hypothetical protein
MEKTMKFWQALVLNIFTGVIICGVTVLMTRASNKVDKNDEVIKNKADISFVVDQDNIIKDRLGKHEQTDDQRWNMLFKRLDQSEQQQNLILSKLIR